MARRGSRRTALALVVLLLLAVLVPPFINVNRYRKRVAESISRALGRDVTVSAIELKLLPRPGLVLTNFVVAENPAYGAEPMLRAETVTASLRLTSLWRGRLEIGRLDLDSPSLNLVRRDDGHWNLEELVGRASEVPTAPTTKSRPESRPRFPYVEASTGRINFKLGLVKQAFAITDADFALWQDSENQWGVRLKGKPVRTNIYLGSAGTLSLDGGFQRAQNLGSTPLQLSLSYERAPLGQISRLVFGRDRGWRGSLTSSATLAGTPASLAITLDAQADDFRRYDIALGESLRMRVHCLATYSSPSDTLRGIQCFSPVGNSSLLVRGDATGWAADAYNLGISGDGLPAERLVAFARHVKKDLPLDLTASGEVGGAFTVRKSAGQPAVWAGGGRITDLALQSGVLRQPLEVGEVEFSVPSAPPAISKRGARSRRPPPPPVPGFQLAVTPFPVALGWTSPATAAASFDEDHYRVSVAGPAELARLLNIAKALGVGTPGVGLAGPAQIDLAVAGSWAAFVPPATSGKIQLHDATAELQGINEPLTIASATANLADRELNVSSFDASFAHGPELSGTARFPVHCTDPATCVVNFDAHSPDVSLARLNQLANPSFRNQPWYHLLMPWQQHGDALMKLRANGHFTAARLDLKTLTATSLSGQVELDAGKLRVSNLRASLLGGAETGDWAADFTASPAVFSGSGTVSRVSMAQLSTLMHDNWAAGNVDGKYNVSVEGLTATALRDSASGSLDFTWNAGALRHLTLEGRGAPLAFSAASGKVSLQNGVFHLTEGKMQSGGSSYAVSGTASYDRDLNLKLEHPGGRSYVVSGPLDSPQVRTVSTPAAEAKLQ